MGRSRSVFAVSSTNLTTQRLVPYLLIKIDRATGLSYNESDYLPMTSVAGDFYDFLVLDEKHLGILIADVSGHGLPSALIASMLQTP